MMNHIISTLIIILDSQQSNKQIMFGNAYQNGSYFEIWDSKVNQDKNQLYKNLFKLYPNSNNKYFDKNVKSYIYSLNSQSSKISFPASDQKQLALHQKYLVLHVNIPIGSAWSMELGITDVNGTKRRINITTNQGKQQVKYFSLRYPVDHLERGLWVFMAFNIYSFMQAFKDQVFRSLDHITICSNCSLRRIFTMKQWNQLQIPKNFWFHPQVQQQFQLIEYQSMLLPKIQKNLMMNGSEPVHSLYEKLTPNKRQSKIALGKSEISPKQNLAKSKIYHQNRSPSKPVSLEPITKKKIEKLPNNNSKFRLNSMKDGLFHKNIDYPFLHSQEKKPIDPIPGQIRQSHIGYDKIKKLSNKKVGRSPKIQKSFQEDEALNYGVVVDYGADQTSHESNMPHIHIDEASSQQLQKKKGGSNTKKTQKSKEKLKIEEQQWSEEDILPVQLQQSINKKEKGGTNEQNRAIIKKQGNQIVIESQSNTQIELIYDEMVDCYYHPETHTYYEIKQ